VGWLDWIRETAQQVGTAIRTGLRGVIELAEEIEPYLPFRPATEAQIEEAMEEAIYADRFIQEALPDEAIRLARGYLTQERLTNVWRTATWTQQDIYSIQPGEKQYLIIRSVHVGPDGAMTHTDVRFPGGQKFDYDEWVRRTASALDDDFVARYDVGRSALVRQFTVHQETYIEQFATI